MKSESEKWLEQFGVAFKKTTEILLNDPRYIKILNEAMIECLNTGERNDEKYKEKIKALIQEMENENRI